METGNLSLESQRLLLLHFKNVFMVNINNSMLLSFSKKPEVSLFSRTHQQQDLLKPDSGIGQLEICYFKPSERPADQ